jgi:hypothetical protein
MRIKNSSESQIIIDRKVDIFVYTFLEECLYGFQICIRIFRFIFRRHNLLSNKVTLSLLWKKEVSSQKNVVRINGKL